MSQCLFCERTKLTKEHLWPNWIVRLFKTRVPPRKGIYRLTQYHKGVPIRTWSTNRITAEARVVCKSCNENWMSDLESHAKPFLIPLIQGLRPVSPFTADEACAIAAWLTLRSMVFESLRPPPNKPYYSQTDRSSFAFGETLSPPDNTFIWLAPFGTPRYSASYVVHNWIAKTASETVGMHSTTVVIDQIAMQLLTWKGQRRRMNWERLERDGWNNLSRLLWPFRTRPVYWPPPQHLPNQLLQTFGNRFRPTSTRDQ